MGYFIKEIYDRMYGKIFKDVLYKTALDIDEQLAPIVIDIGENQTWNLTDLNYVDFTESIFYEALS